jgi:hypothetical protein
LGHHKILLIALIMLCLFSTGYSESKKEIKAVVEEFPNYIFHLQTLGGIVPADSEYISLYKDSMPKKDQIYLNEHRSLLNWGDGSTGPLTAFFMFLPAYINFQSPMEFNEYFDSLSKALQNRDINRFIQKYNCFLKKREVMFGPRDIKSDLQSIIQYADVVTQIGEIYKNNFQTYHLNVWPQEQEKLGKSAKVINSELQKYDLINNWEKLTGVRFKTNEYQIVLFSANKNGPNANSLGYDRNAFYYDRDTQTMVQFISHEVGTHLLIDVFNQVMQMNRFEYSDVYKAYENMAEFYNVKFIFKGQPLYGYDVKKYYQIYTDLYDSNQNISPTDLMIKGLEVYTAPLDSLSSGT